MTLSFSSQKPHGVPAVVRKWQVLFPYIESVEETSPMPKLVRRAISPIESHKQPILFSRRFR